ncbi:hypothetical protein BP5796_07714 [Coleophoma crateriformis]|uniref:Uncharacterized protein n=1 Tax=Coleophoma crateriformis TaxID=565419 RepID=A0A3D8RCH8_9HELO|nr:hypothetical protein BP5796_07714 [Coleophoma crateriformis]
MSRVSLLLLATAARAIYAQNCDAYSNLVKTQSDIDALAGCSAVSGYIGIELAFQGKFYLAGVASIGSINAGNAGASHSTPTQGTPRITSFSMPDLETAKSITFSGVPYLDAFSMPKLKSTDFMELGNMGAVTALSFPALEKLGGNTILSGPLDTIDFSSLTSATSIWIESTGNLDCAALGAQLASISWPSGDGYGLDCVSALNAYHSANTAFAQLFPQSAGVVHATSSAAATSQSSTQQATTTEIPSPTSSPIPAATETTTSISTTASQESASTTTTTSTTASPGSTTTTVLTSTHNTTATSIPSTTEATTSSRVSSLTSSSRASSTSSVPTLVSSGAWRSKVSPWQAMIGLSASAILGLF